MKLKEALVKDGFLAPDKLGKGRPSKAMIARAHELVASGWAIEGFSISKPTAATGKPAVEVVHKPTASVTKEIPDVGPPIREPNQWEALVDGKPHPLGIKAICNNCHNSLTYCRCRYPVVNVDHNTVGVVTFRQKKEGI